MGPCTVLGDAKEVRILNRIVSGVKPPCGAGRECIECEADPRAELTIHQLFQSRWSSISTNITGMEVSLVVSYALLQGDRIAMAEFFSSGQIFCAHSPRLTGTALLDDLHRMFFCRIGGAHTGCTLSLPGGLMIASGCFHVG